MANQVKYLDYAGLQALVTQIKAGDAAALKAAKDYVGAIPAGATETTVIAYLEAKIAEAAKAENVSIVDANDKFNATNVEDALAEVKGVADANTAALETINSTDATKAGSLAKTLADAKKYTDDEIGELGSTYTNVKDYIDKHDAAVMKIISNEQGTLTDLTTDAKTNIVAAINEVDAHVDANTTAIGTAKSGETAGTGLTGRIETLEAAIGEGGGVAQQIKNAIEALDADITSSAVEAGKGLQVEVKEVDGKVTEVAVTGDFSNTYDAKGAADTAKSEAITASAVTISTDTTTEGALKTYTFSQNGAEIGKIDLAKDLVVTAGEVVKDPEGKPAGTYLVLTIANQTEKVYINVKDLVDVYTGKTETDGISVTVSDTNVISAAISGKAVARTNIADDFEEDIAALEGTHGTKLVEGETVFKTVSEQISAEAKDAEYKAAEGEKAAVSIKGALDDIYAQIGEGGGVAEQIKAAIEDLDAEKSQAASTDNGQLALSITEVDGKITAISGSIAADTYDTYGAAAAVSGTWAEGATPKTVAEVSEKLDNITSISDKEITDLFKTEE